MKQFAAVCRSNFLPLPYVRTCITNVSFNLSNNMVLRRKVFNPLRVKNVSPLYIERLVQLDQFFSTSPFLGSNLLQFCEKKNLGKSSVLFAEKFLNSHTSCIMSPCSFNLPYTEASLSNSRI